MLGNGAPGAVWLIVTATTALVVLFVVSRWHHPQPEAPLVLQVVAAPPLPPPAPHFIASPPTMADQFSREMVLARSRPVEFPPDADDGPTVQAGQPAEPPWEPKPCPGPCVLGLYCDPERGACVCPWERSGADCEVPAELQSCRLRPAHAPGARGDPTDVPHCGGRHPRPCDCLRRCRHGLGLESTASAEPALAALAQGWRGRDLPDWELISTGLPCWVRAGTPGDAARQRGLGLGAGGDFAAANRSDWADPPTAAEPATFYRSLSHFLSAGAARPDGVVVPRTVARLLGLLRIDGHLALPLSSCPLSCSYRGECVAPPPPGRHSGWPRGRDDSESAAIEATAAVGAACRCYAGSVGPGCEASNDESCYNRCSRRGTCAQGICHCDAGRWGIDCSRDVGPPRRLPPAPDPGRLAVYVYELPPEIGLMYETDRSPRRGHRDAPNYGAAHVFLSRLLSDARVRTDDPGQATLFYVPHLGYGRAGNTGDPHDGLATARAYVQRAWPFWNRTGGRDHVFWAGGGDLGLCRGGDAVRDSIRITHYGRRDVWPDASGWLSPCAVASRDVIAPPHSVDGVASAEVTFGIVPGSVSALSQHVAWARPTLLFFAGTVRRNADPEYSQGVRVALLALAGRAGVSIAEAKTGRRDYSAALRSSLFCAAVTGYGFGMRFTEAMAHGCIPVRVEENVEYAFEDLLPYDSFSLLFRSRDIPALPDVLAAVRPEQVAALQAGVRRHHAAFLWSAGAGAAATAGPGGATESHGTAYEHMLASLSARAAARATRNALRT